MAPFYSFSPKTTSISFPWPAEITGLERIMLSAQGDLQRVISAFFSRPINIVTVFSHTFTHVTPGLPAVPLNLPNPHAIASTSPDTPITQTRQVHLQCANRIVCTATSTVRITSPRCAHLFLEEKYAIGQMFRKLEKLPQFELLEVGFGNPDAPTDDSKEQFKDRSHDNQLWRKYKLVVPEFECEILEVFPSRDMFSYGEDWLLGKQPVARRFAPHETEMGVKFALASPRWQASLALLFGLAFLLMLAFEILIFFTGRRAVC